METTEGTNSNRVAPFERRIKRLERTILYIMAAVLGLAGAIWHNSRTSDVLRVKGVVILDDEGRDRILIGAPIPASMDRMRTDMAAVRRSWASRMPTEYMKWYESYRHDMNGILVLDEHGTDRIAFGHDYPDPIIGQRLGRGTGLVINDSTGLERSGYGLLTVAGEDRVVLGIDRNNGTEGVSLVALEDGTTGLVVNDNIRQERLLLGRGPTTTVVSDTVPLGLIREDETGVHRGAYENDIAR
ncbi:MAG: hypothetical protein IPJ76_09025 [Flavobacteriales bacterium]|nr:MAG: hypothetical protein IPJ76_09025 [Flavobacteriales bacterium]